MAILPQSRIFLDANASYGMTDAARRAFIETADGNPSSIHQRGQQARLVLENCRRQLRQYFNLPKARVTFSSGATESNNQALETLCAAGLAKTASLEQALLITTAIEHPCIIEKSKELQSRGATVLWLPVALDGTVDCAAVQTLDRAERYSRVAVSIMHSNNEVGIVLDVATAVQKIRKKFPHAVFHSDVSQSVGRVSTADVTAQIDCWTISGHKLGGAIGVGALICNDRITPEPLLLGGAQELRARAGTENVPAIAALGAVLQELAGRALYAEPMRERRELLRKKLVSIPQLSFIENPDPSRMLPNTLCSVVGGILAEDLVVALDIAGVEVSSGSACSSGKTLPSHVLLGLGYSPEIAKSSIRLSWRHDIALEQIEQAGEILQHVIARALSQEQLLRGAA